MALYCVAVSGFTENEYVCIVYKSYVLINECVLRV